MTTKRQLPEFGSVLARQIPGVVFLMKSQPYSKRLPWFRVVFASPTFPIGIDVDAKTRTRVWKSSSRLIVPPLTGRWPFTDRKPIGLLLGFYFYLARL